MAVVNSKISFENFDPYKALAYLVIVAGREALIEAGLRHLIPRWRGDRETALKVTGDAGRNMDNWVFVPIKISKRDEIKIIAMLMEVGVLLIMNCNVYEFGGKYY